MTAAVEILFHDVSEKSFYPYLDIPEYNQYSLMEDKAEARLQKVLTPDQAKLLEELCQARNYCASIEQEAAFQAGLSIGLELSRL